MAVKIRYKTEIAIIGASQAELCAGYNLKKMGLVLGRDFIILDAANKVGGAWQSRGGIKLSLRMAKKVAEEPRIHLIGYDPSASTSGANSAGGDAARKLSKIFES